MLSSSNVINKTKTDSTPSTPKRLRSTAPLIHNEDIVHQKRLRTTTVSTYRSVWSSDTGFSLDATMCSPGIDDDSQPNVDTIDALHHFPQFKPYQCNSAFLCGTQSSSLIQTCPEPIPPRLDLNKDRDDFCAISATAVLADEIEAHWNIDSPLNLKKHTGLGLNLFEKQKKINEFTCTHENGETVGEEQRMSTKSRTGNSTVSKSFPQKANNLPHENQDLFCKAQNFSHQKYESYTELPKPYATSRRLRNLNETRASRNSRMLFGHGWSSDSETNSDNDSRSTAASKNKNILFNHDSPVYTTPEKEKSKSQNISGESSTTDWGESKAATDETLKLFKLIFDNNCLAR